MKRFVLPLLVLVGACLVLTGAWWTWTGFDIVQVERGWSSVIAGATMLSAGFIVLALAALLGKLEEIAASMRAAPSPRAERADEKEGLPAAPPKPMAIVAQAIATGEPKRDDRAEPSPREIVGTHTSGDATYTMFSDGSVEAKTADGTLSFASLDELRAYADERALADAR